MEQQIKPWVVSLVAVYFTDLSEYKIRPVLLFKKMQEDYLFLPLSSNLKKTGIIISSKDLKWWDLKQKSVIIIPKCWVIYKDSILKVIAELKEDVFQKVKLIMCKAIEC